MNELLHSDVPIVEKQDRIEHLNDLENPQDRRAQQIAHEQEVVAKKLGTNSHKYEKHLAKNYLNWLERQTN